MSTKKKSFPKLPPGGPGTPRPLTLKERTAISEYIKTGKKAAAFKSAYKSTPQNVYQRANMFFKKPRIVSALEKALKESKFDDSFAVDTLKKITQAGLQNLDITRPDTSLKALETYFKITGKMGGGTKTPTRIDPETVAKKMDVTELQQALKDMDKRQKRILAIIQGSAEEGEVVK